MSSIAAKIITKSSSISLEVIISVSPGRQNPQTQQRSRSPVPGPSGIGRQNLTASLAQAASTVSVLVNVLTGSGCLSAAVKSSCSLSVISQTDLKLRINERMQRESRKYFIRKNSCVNSRILFEETNCELFFFPAVKNTRDSSRYENIINNLSLLDLGPPWGVVVCFFLKCNKRIYPSIKSQSFFKEKNGFPEGVNAAVPLCFLSKGFSLLFCETGRITISSGQAVLEGLELVILQKKHGKMISLFCKKNTLSPTSPVRPLPLCNNKPFIRVRCCCRASGFSFFLNIPVLTKSELKEEPYNVTSNQKCNIFQLDNFCNHLIAFPDDMGMHLPFDGFIGGKLICSLQIKDNPIVQLIFIPDSVRLKAGIHFSCSFKFFNWTDEDMQFSQEQASRNIISIYNFPQVTLSFNFELEATISGLEIKLISTKNTGAWGVLLSRKKTGPLSASIPHTTQESNNSPVPGPSRTCPFFVDESAPIDSDSEVNLPIDPVTPEGFLQSPAKVFKLAEETAFLQPTGITSKFFSTKKSGSWRVLLSRIETGSLSASIPHITQESNNSPVPGPSRTCPFFVDESAPIDSDSEVNLPIDPVTPEGFLQSPAKVFKLAEETAFLQPTGITSKFFSTKKSGSWRVLLSRIETGSLSASIPHITQESNNSPVPGPSRTCPFFVDESAPIDSDSEVNLPIDPVTPEGFLQSPAKVFKLAEETAFLQPTGITSKFFSTKKSGSWRVLLSRIETGSLSASIPHITQESNNSPVPGPSRTCPFFVDESAPIDSDSEVNLPIDPVTPEVFLQSPAKVFKLAEETAFLQPTGITSKFFSTKKSGSCRVLLSRIGTGSLSASIPHATALINNETEDEILKEINLSHSADLLSDIETVSPLVSFEDLCQSKIDAISESFLDPLGVETNRDQINSLAFSSNVFMSPLEKAREKPSSESVLPAEFLLLKRLFSSELQKKFHIPLSKKKNKKAKLKHFLVKKTSLIELDTSEKSSQSATHALQAGETEGSLQNSARDIQLPGPSGIGRRNLTASLAQAASTVSVLVNVFTGSGTRSAAVKSSCSLSVISKTDLKRRVNERMQRESRKYFIRKNNCVNSRILFEKTNCELFLFPSVKKMRDSSRYNIIFNNLFLFDMGPPWGVVVCFFAKCKKRIYGLIKNRSFYKEKDGFPEGVSAAVQLCFLPKSVSLLFCETGGITISSGQAVLEGLELVILQKRHGKMLSLFCKKKTLSLTSSVRPLPLCNNKPFIRVRCCCRASGFSFFLNIPVLTKGELKKEPYNITSNQKYNIFQLDNFCNHLIAFPDDMSMHLPFDGLIGGKLVCSLQRKDNSIIQLIFIPDSVRLKARMHFSCNLKFFNWIDKDTQYSQEQASRNIISIYNIPQVTLSFNFELEATISGLEIKLISTKKTGAWGVLLSRKETSPLSSSIPHTGQESSNSPVPGPSSSCPSGKSTAKVVSSYMDCLTTVTLEDTLALIDDETEDNILKEINLSYPAGLLSDIETVSPLVSFEDLFQSQIDVRSESFLDPLGVETNRDQINFLAFSSNLSMSPLEEAREEPSSGDILPAEFLLPDAAFLLPSEKIFPSEFQKKFYYALSKKKNKKEGLKLLSVKKASPIESDISEKSSQSATHALQSEEPALLHSMSITSIEVEKTPPTGPVTIKGSLQNSARAIQLPGPSGIGRRNLTASLSQAASTVSLLVNVFTGSGAHSAAVKSSRSLSVISQTDLKRRINERIRREISKNCVNSRMLFEKTNYELFLFPSVKTSNPSRYDTIFNNLFLFDMGPPWGVVIYFFATCNRRVSRSKKYKVLYKEKNGFPEGVSAAVQLCFLPKSVSLLFCETGRITMSSGQAVLQGLELVILQKKHGRMLSFFCKKKTLSLTSPVRPLPLCSNKPFIRVRCCCRASGFSFFLNIPVLTKGELKEEPYNVTSNQKCNIFQLDNFCNHLIAFPDDMGMHFPFDGLIGGKLICSLQREGNPIVQLIFIPDLVRLKAKIYFRSALQFFNWIDTDVQYSQEQASRNIISIYNIPQVTLSFNFELEATISGLEIKLISTKKTGAWGVLLSRKEIGPLSASIPHTGQEISNSSLGEVNSSTDSDTSKKSSQSSTYALQSKEAVQQLTYTTSESEVDSSTDSDTSKKSSQSSTHALQSKEAVQQLTYTTSESEVDSSTDSDTSKKSSQSATHALQSEEPALLHSMSITSIEVEKTPPTGPVTIKGSLQNSARAIQLPGPSGIGRRNLTASLSQAASTVSLLVNVFTGSGAHSAAVKSSRSLSVISQTDLKRRINERIRREISKNCVNSRMLFEKTNYELFLFPSVKTSNPSRYDTIFNNLFLFDMGPPWGVVIYFFATCNRRVSRSKKYKVLYKEKNGFPEGVSAAVQLCFLPESVSLLFCETGRITMSSGQAVLQGLELVILQKKHGRMLSFFCKKKTLSLTSPVRPLPLCSNKPFIRVRCCCRASGFSFFLNIPVLTKGELKEEPYNVTSNQKCNIFQLDNFCNHLIAFPDDMGMHLPFDGLIGGKLICSLQREGNPIVQLIFIPDLVRLKANFYFRSALQFFNWIDTDVQYSQEQASRNIISIYNIPQVTLSFNFELEATISGLEIKLISTKKTGAWGVLLSRKEIGHLSASIPHKGQEISNSSLGEVNSSTDSDTSKKSSQSSTYALQSKEAVQQLTYTTSESEVDSSTDSDTSEKSSQNATHALQSKESVEQLTDTTSESDVDSSTDSDTSKKSSQSATHSFQSKKAVEQPTDTTSESEVDSSTDSDTSEKSSQNARHALQSKESVEQLTDTTSESDVDSSIDSDTSKKSSQSATHSFQSKKAVEQPTDTTSESEVDSSTDSDTSEKSSQNATHALQSKESVEQLTDTTSESDVDSSTDSDTSKKSSQSATHSFQSKKAVEQPTDTTSESEVDSSTDSDTSEKSSQNATHALQSKESVEQLTDTTSESDVDSSTDSDTSKKSSQNATHALQSKESVEQLTDTTSESDVDSSTDSDTSKKSSQSATHSFQSKKAVEQPTDTTSESEVDLPTGSVATEGCLQSPARIIQSEKTSLLEPTSTVFETKETSHTGPVTTEGSLQSPERIFQSEETAFLQPTGITSIEVETTSSTGSVASEKASQSPARVIQSEEETKLLHATGITSIEVETTSSTDSVASEKLSQSPVRVLQPKETSLLQSTSTASDFLGVFPFEQNEEDAGEGSSSRALSTSVHRPQAKRLFPTESKDQAKGKKKNRLESLMEVASSRESDTSEKSSQSPIRVFQSEETEASWPSLVCSMISIHGMHRATFFIPYTKDIVFYKEVNSHVKTVTLERKLLFFLGENLLALLPEGVIVQHGVGFANAQLSIVKEEKSGSIFIGFIPMNQAQSYFMSCFTVNRWSHPYLSKMKGNLSRMPLSSLKSYLFECPSFVTVKMVSATECILIGMSVFILTDPRIYSSGALLFELHESPLSLSTDTTSESDVDLPTGFVATEGCLQSTKRVLQSEKTLLLQLTSTDSDSLGALPFEEHENLLSFAEDAGKGSSSRALSTETHPPQAKRLFPTESKDQAKGKKKNWLKSLMEVASSRKSDTSEKSSQSATHAFQSKEAVRQLTDTTSESDVDLPTDSVATEGSLQSPAMVLQSEEETVLLHSMGIIFIEVETTSPTASVATEGCLQSPERVFQSEETALLYSTGITFIEVETTSPIGSVTTEGFLQNPERDIQLPGPSGIGNRNPTASLTQAAAIVSVPSERQEQHISQRGRSSPVPGPSCIRDHPYAQGGPESSGFGRYLSGFSYPSSEATGLFLSEGQEQQAQLAPEAPQRRIIRPLPVYAQPAATFSVPLEGQSQHTWPWDRRGFVSESFGVRHHPYARPFGFGFYPYGFLYPQPAATGPYGFLYPQPAATGPYGFLYPQPAATGPYGFLYPQPAATGPYGFLYPQPAATGPYGFLYPQPAATGPYGFLYPQPAATGPFLSEGQEQQVQLAPEAPQQRIIHPLPVYAQRTFTVSVPFEGQSQHTGTWDRRGFVSESSTSIDIEAISSSDFVTSEESLQSSESVLQSEEETALLQPTSTASESEIEVETTSSTGSVASEKFSQSPAKIIQSKKTSLLEPTSTVFETKETSHTGTVTTEGSLQSPARVFQSEETAFLKPTGITSIEVETTSSTDSVASEKPSQSPERVLQQEETSLLQSTSTASDFLGALPFEQNEEDAGKGSSSRVLSTSVHRPQAKRHFTTESKDQAKRKKNLQLKSLMKGASSIESDTREKPSQSPERVLQPEEISLLQSTNTASNFLGALLFEQNEEDAGEGSSSRALSTSVHRPQAKRYFTTESKDQAKRKKTPRLKSLMKRASSIESDTIEKPSQSPVRVLQSKETMDTSFIEVEITALTGAVTTEDSTEVSSPSPVCSMTSIHGMQRATFSIPYIKSVIFYKEVNSQINAVILERKKLFSDGKNLLAVLPKQASFQHGVGFENAQLSVVKDNKSRKISIGFISMNQPTTHLISHWIHKKWTHPYLSNVKGNLSRIQLASLRGYLFECPLSATIKMISSTECVLLGMSVFILTDSNSSPVAFLFARNEGLLSLTEEVGEGFSSNTLSTSVHRPQAKRLLPTESKGQAKRKKKNRVESLMEGTSGSDANILQSEVVTEPVTDTVSEVEKTVQAGSVAEVSIESNLSSLACSMISIQGLYEAIISISYKSLSAFYEEIKENIASLEKIPEYQSCSKMTLERKDLFSNGQSLLAVLPKQAIFQHGVGFENAQLSVVKENKSSKIFIGFIPINHSKTNPMSHWVIKKWGHPYLSNVKGNLARMQLISLRAYLFECPLSATIKMISSTECVLLGMSVVILTDSNSFPVALLFARNEDLLSLTEEAGEGSSSNALSTSVHSSQAKRHFTTESKDQAKRKKKPS